MTYSLARPPEPYDNWSEMVVEYFSNYPGGTIQELAAHHNLRSTSRISSTANRLLYRRVLVEVDTGPVRRYEVRR